MYLFSIINKEAIYPIHGTGIFTYIYVVDFYGKCR